MTATAVVSHEVADARGKLGMERAANKAEQVVRNWIAKTVEEVRTYADNNPGEFTIEQARQHCSPMPDGVDARAWGQVTLRAVALGVIVATGGYARAASSNRSPKPLYRNGKCRQAPQPVAQPAPQPVLATAPVESETATGCETKFEKWALKYGVANLVSAMKARGPNDSVTYSAVYQWLRGQHEPRPRKMRAMVEISAGEITLNDIAAHFESKAHAAAR